jgi:3'(2'), 5'-bisphosphate nucleotidase
MTVEQACDSAPASWARELTVATEVARAAADLVSAAYSLDVAVNWKAGDDPVTEADRRANSLICERLRAEFPLDAICAEESAEEDSARAASRGGRCWFVDPLDGTREFIRKSGEFCVMVGLSLAGQPVLGVVVAPAWGRTFRGAVGQGAHELTATGERRPLRPRTLAQPAGRRVVLSRLHRNEQVDRAAAALGLGEVRQCGSTGLKFLLVAMGEVDLYLHTGPGPKLWDGCAPEAIARAAGLQVTDAAGQALRYDTAHLPLDQGIIVGTRELATLAVGALRS